MTEADPESESESNPESESESNPESESESNPEAESESDAESASEPLPPRLDPERDLAPMLDSAAGLCFCTDFDGTLTAIVDDPDAPEITPENERRLRELADAPGVQVAVVSGRQLSDLRTRVGIEGISYAGNHGLELYHDGETVVHPVAANRRQTIQDLCTELADRLADVDGCVIENKGVTATIHYRNVADERVDDVRETVESVVEERASDRIDVSRGKAIVELWPAVPWDKGRVVQLFADEADDDWASMYVGDDTTDEFAFEALVDGDVGVYVGEDGKTAATHHVPDVAAVEEMLGWLADEGVGRLE